MTTDYERFWANVDKADSSATTGRCPTPGCPGDWRYAAPGRGHTAECKHPADFRAWVGQAFPPSSDPSATTDGGAS